jgi:hypothetical protein
MVGGWMLVRRLTEMSHRDVPVWGEAQVESADAQRPAIKAVGRSLFEPTRIFSRWTG